MTKREKDSLEKERAKQRKEDKEEQELKDVQYRNNIHREKNERPRDYPNKPPVANYNVYKMCEIIEDYLTKAQYPKAKEVCFLNNWNYKYVMCVLTRRNPVLKDAFDRLHDKKEIQVETSMIDGSVSFPACRFILKQPVHGWTEQVTEDNSSAEQVIDSIGNLLVKVKQSAVLDE